MLLAERDKVEMEDDIRSKFASTGNTRVICRSGNPLDLDDLAVVDPHSARSIVVLAPETENPDIHVIKSVLAITNNPSRKQDAYHIVAEIREPRNDFFNAHQRHEAERQIFQGTHGVPTLRPRRQCSANGLGE